MSDLSPEARAIVDAARPAGSATDADRERVRAALRLKLLAAAAVASSGTTSSPSTQAVAAAGSGKYLAVLVLATVVGGALFWRSRGQHTEAVDNARFDDSLPRPSTRTLTTPRLPIPAPATAPAPAAVIEPAAPVAIAPDPLPARRGGTNARATALAHAPLPAEEPAAAPVVPTPEPVVTPPPPVPAPEPASRSTLADETRRLDEARTALRTNPSYALELLDEWNAIRPNGELREERRAQRVAALCALGRVEGARLEADRLLAEAPQSAQAGRVRASCAFVGR